MQSPRWLIVASTAALLAALAAACGGGSNDKPSASNPDEIPTATLPATLPDPIILGEGQVPGNDTTYIVQDGDSPSSIAAQFDITAEELMAANGITDPTALVVGLELTIPGAGPPDVLGATPEPSPAPTDAPPPPSGDGQTYVVQDGDIPETIAAQFGITADALLAANGITDPTSLQVGQELVIPAP